MKRLAIFAALVFLSAGCVTSSINSERVLAYSPDISGRSFGVVEAVETSGSSGAGTNSTERGTVLNRGDRIMIHLLGIEPTMSLEDVIDDRGNVNLPHIGVTKLGGMTTHDAERLVENTYIDEQIFKSITISIVKQFEGEISVRGYVKRPGRYKLSGDLTLSAAISEAGGFSPFADKKRVQILRGKKKTVYNVKKIEAGEASNPLVKDDDEIFVPKGWY